MQLDPEPLPSEQRRRVTSMSTLVAGPPGPGHRAVTAGRYPPPGGRPGRPGAGWAALRPCGSRPDQAVDSCSNSRTGPGVPVRAARPFALSATGQDLRPSTSPGPRGHRHRDPEPGDEQVVPRSRTCPEPARRAESIRAPTRAPAQTPGDLGPEQVTAGDDQRNSVPFPARSARPLRTLPATSSGVVPDLFTGADVAHSHEHADGQVRANSKGTGRTGAFATFFPDRCRVISVAQPCAFA